MWFFSVYYFFQLNIHHYYGYFFSVRFLIKGMPDVGEYTFDFIKSTSFISFFFFITALIFSFIYSKLFNYKQSRFKRPYLLLIISFSLFLGSLFIGDSKSQFESSFSLFLKPYYQELAVDQLGLLPFLFSDLRYLFYEDTKAVTPPNAPIEELPPVPEVPSLTRVIDDKAWRLIASEETNTTMQSIDQYLLNKKITNKNDFTGKYEDMNLVYFLVEALDMIAIHPTLTPTLNKLKEKGTYFDSFYSPQYNCATAESELMSLSSVYPVIGTCTMSAYYQHASPQNLYQLFKKKGYTSSSYHNWNDQFYPRSLIHPVLGSDSYHDLDEMIPSIISGWQSDLTMMEHIVPMLNAKTENPFFAYVITSSTHLPYDTDTNLSMKYRSKVKEVYPEAPYEIQNYLSKAIELDLALQYLIENLNEMDNTVLVLFSDHRPLRMPPAYLNEYSDIDRFHMNDMDRTPMMIYHPTQIPLRISSKSSTIDLAPTIANLFNLDYDPRLFIGEDLMSEDAPTVIFQNGNFYDKNGYFSASKGTYTPNEAELEMSQDISVIKSKLEVSSAIYLEKYFTQRKDYFK